MIQLRSPSGDEGSALPNCGASPHRAHHPKRRQKTEEESLADFLDGMEKSRQLRDSFGGKMPRPNDDGAGDDEEEED